MVPHCSKRKKAAALQNEPWTPQRKWFTPGAIVLDSEKHTRLHDLQRLMLQNILPVTLCSTVG
jgi:hypothetical protein